MKQKTFRLAITSMFTAIIFIATYFLQIPAFTGSINCGDGIILITSLWLGFDSILAAALGSAISDILSGYAIYAPATLIIKALMAFAATWLLRVINKRVLGRILAFCTAEAIMICGYFLFDMFFYGITGAMFNIGSNSIQAAIAVFLGMLLSAIQNPLAIYANRKQ